MRALKARARVEHGGRGVRETTFGHHSVRFECRLQVSRVDSECHSHEHHLRPLHHLPRLVRTNEVGPFERFEAKVIVPTARTPIKCRVDFREVLRCELAHVVGEAKEDATNGRFRHLFEVGVGDSGGKEGVVGVLRREGGGRFRGKVVEGARLDAVVHAVDDSFGHTHRIDRQAVGQALDSCENLVEGHWLSGPVALDHEHPFPRIGVGISEASRFAH